MLEEKFSKPWWLDIKAGRLLADAETEVLSDILPKLYGYHLVQCAPPMMASFVNATLIGHRVLVNLEASSNWPCSLVCGEMEQLSLLADSVDVMVLTHSLEMAKKPHQVLREAHRCLIPEGHIVITGINPFSCWGIYSCIKRLFNRSIQENIISPNRIKDWLELLDVEVTQSHMFYFRPPIANKKINFHLKFLEKLGQRFWPFLGGGYAIVGVKKIVGLTPIKPRFKEKESWEVQGVAGSASYKRNQK